MAIALPAIVTNITTPLLGLCDVAIAGHRGGASFIATLAVATSMFNMLYWMLGFLRMGTSGLTAQAFGATDRLRGATVLWRGLLLALAGGAVIIGLQKPLAGLLLRVMDVDAATAAYAMRYFSIVVWGAPAVLSLYVLTGWLLGMQNTSIAMWVSLLTNLVNIAVGVALVFGMGMFIEGVAIGALVAQWIAVTVIAAVSVFRFRPPRPMMGELLSGAGLGAFMRVNTDIFLRTVCLVAVTMWFTRAGARQGDLMLAVNALLMQFFTLFSYFMDGFAFSAEALVGRWIGASDYCRLRRTVRTEQMAGLCMALLFTVVYALGGHLLLRMLTDDSQVVATALAYMPWVVAVPLAGFMAFICDGIMIGLSRTRLMLASVAAGMAVFFALEWLLAPAMGNTGLWLAFVTYLVVRSGVMFAVTAWPGHGVWRSLP